VEQEVMWVVEEMRWMTEVDVWLRWVQGLVIGTTWLLFAASSEVSLLLEKRHAAALQNLQARTYYGLGVGV
jgi:hypothetical protein